MNASGPRGAERPSDTPNELCIPDEELVRQCRTQLPYDTTAFGNIVERYESAVLMTCYRILGSLEDAEEVCQDVFMRVFHGLPGFRGDASFRTWIFRIARNTCASRGAGIERRRRLTDVYRALESASAVAPAGTDSTRDRVQEILSRMAEPDREILGLRYAADLPIQDLADTLDLGLSATKMRLYRAQDRFKAAYLIPDKLPSD
ncbi:MAG: sigma-70 family RNA polymerase sigma factor [Gemmatimonadales bacterium]|nr:MAG: sigma-70 family RNA polymerase sigma factor [Gemmatimonadales bacterium]